MNIMSYYNTAKEEIVRYLSNRALLEHHLNQDAGATDLDKVFTRDSKFGLKHLLTYLIMPRAESTSVELDRYCNLADIESVTKQTFFQKRKYIKPSLLWNLHNTLLLDSYGELSNSPTFHGRYLLAVDGSTIALPATDELWEKYGKSSQTNYPIARMLVIRDVLKGEIVYLSLASYTTSEYEMVIKALKEIPYVIKSSSIFIFDRGYVASWMFSYLNKLNIEYVMRLPKGFNKNVDRFFESKKSQTDTQIEVSQSSWSQKTGRRYESLGMQNAAPVYLHLYGLQLPHGEREVLAVSIHNIQLNVLKIGELYNYRWRVETTINELKNELQIEIFSGHSVLAVEQDVASKVIAYNLGQQLSNEAIIEHEKRVKTDRPNCKEGARKHRYKINQNIMWYFLQRLVVEYFNSNVDTERDILQHYIQLVQMNWELIRPGRHEPHLIRTTHNSGKYVTFNNYRRVL